MNSNSFPVRRWLAQLPRRDIDAVNVPLKSTDTVSDQTIKRPFLPGDCSIRVSGINRRQRSGIARLMHDG